MALLRKYGKVCNLRRMYFAYGRGADRADSPAPKPGRTCLSGATRQTGWARPPQLFGWTAAVTYPP